MVGKVWRSPCPLDRITVWKPDTSIMPSPTSDGSTSDRPTLAVLILAHANPGVFHRMVEALDHPQITVFCHLDAKADMARFSIGATRRIVFIEARQSVFWGGYSMIEAELALFRAARAAGPFAAYALISGDSLPLIDNEALVKLLPRPAHTLRFVEQLPGDKSYARIERIYLPDTSIGAFSKPGTHLDRHLDPEDFALVRRAMAVRRLKRTRSFRVFKGRQWFSVTDALLERMLAQLEADPDYEEVLRFTAIPDELFFHCLLKIVDPAARSEFAMMGADWSRKPMPYVFRSDQEFDFIMGSGCVFFRKFSDGCLSLVDRVLGARLSGEQVLATGNGPVVRYLSGSENAFEEEASEDSVVERHE